MTMTEFKNMKDKQALLTKEKAKEIALERFKDWYLRKFEHDDWLLPLYEQLQRVDGDKDLKDLQLDMAHYYFVHQIDQWDDLENQIEEYEADHGQTYADLLIEYIIETTKE